jgi:hypothetical protein
VEEKSMAANLVDLPTIHGMEEIFVVDIHRPKPLRRNAPQQPIIVETCSASRIASQIASRTASLNWYEHANNSIGF